MKKILENHYKPLLLLLSSFGLYFITLFARMIQMRSDGLYVGHDHVWADWPLHIGIAQIFATKHPENWFRHHPMYAYGKFTYSWATDFISGMLMRIGFTVVPAFIIPSILLALLLIVGMYFLIYTATHSKKVAVIAIALFFLSSGPGFLNYFKDISINPSFETVFYPVKHYSRNDDYSWYAGNFIVGMLVPQRAFLMGLTVSVWSLTLFLYGISRELTPRTKKILIGGGILAGILPVAHMHSFICVVIITSLVSVLYLKQWRRLLYFGAPATVISLALYFIFIHGGIENPQFMSLKIGYTAKGGLLPWIQMWWNLWGVMIPGALLGLYLLRKESVQLQVFVSSFFAIFLIANTILFQPIEWDNSKFFLWAYWGFSVSTAFVLVKIQQVIPRVGIILSLLLFASLTLTGMTELLRLQHIERNSYQIISTDDMKLAEAVRATTDENAVFLTAPSTNSPIMMWGARPIMMGFVGWVNNFGFLYTQRLEDMRAIYYGNQNTPQLIKKYKISYVVIGRGEIVDFTANQAYFDAHYPVAFQNNSQKIYDVRN